MRSKIKVDPVLGSYKLSELRMTSMKPAGSWFEFIRVPCPICGKSGNCMIKKDGKQVVCTRKPSNVLFSKYNESWVHNLEVNEASKPIEAKIIDKQTEKTASAYHLDKVYNIVLEFYGLNDKHRKELVETRRMDSFEVNVRKYASFSEEVKQGVVNFDSGESESVWEKLFIDNGLKSDAWKGVPGFYCTRILNKETGELKEVPLFTTQNGLLIPSRDEEFKVTGMQIKPDKRGFKRVDIINGPTGISLEKTYLKDKPVINILDDYGNLLKTVLIKNKKNYQVMTERGLVEFKAELGAKYAWVSTANYRHGARKEANVHFAYNLSTDHDVRSVWISEGFLKADIITNYLNKAYKKEDLDILGHDVISVAGVKQYRRIVEKIDELSEIKRVTLAFDMDFITNNDVKNAYKGLVGQLKKRNIEIFIAIWDLEKNKGLDDLLTNHLKPKIKKLNN